MARSIHEFNDVALTNAQEAALWDRFYECAEEGSYLIEGKQDELHALIREAHVVVEREGELLGLFVTQKQQDWLNGPSTPRFLWISHVLSGKHAGEVCMADEDTDAEFQYQQHP